jgi:hypothetical protein
VFLLEKKKGTRNTGKETILKKEKVAPGIRAGHEKMG